jgi:hypothetical protein
MGRKSSGDAWLRNARRADLIQEVESLRTELQERTDEFHRAQAMQVKNYQQAGRLRAALQQILDVEGEGFPDEALYRMEEIARQALEES